MLVFLLQLLGQSPGRAFPCCRGMWLKTHAPGQMAAFPACSDRIRVLPGTRLSVASGRRFGKSCGHAPNAVNRWRHSRLFGGRTVQARRTAFATPQAAPRLGKLKESPVPCITKPFKNLLRRLVGEFAFQFIAGGLSFVSDGFGKLLNKTHCFAFSCLVLARY